MQERGGLSVVVRGPQGKARRHLCVVAALACVLAFRSAYGEQTRYFYDELGRLVRVERPEGVVVKYTYDAVGNRLSRTVVHDLDYDDVPDSEDNCVSTPNPGQEDTDGDLVGDACDNCVSVPNSDQANEDGDPAGNACDCAPEDASAFDVPHEIRNLRWPTDKVTLEWDSDAPNSGSGTVYDVMRGVLSEFPVGTGPSETCLEADSPDTTAEDADIPASGAGFYYLTRGQNNCGAGTYGFESTGTERTTSACP